MHVDALTQIGPKKYIDGQLTSSPTFRPAGNRPAVSSITFPRPCREHWSSGQAEGQFNRLKTLKRAMYGRAGIELLRARMLPFETAMCT
ncbi:hypothetical protein B1812_09010 [Methylocystis bryophila]|uniref:Transposase IS204/IS1001/IS1096/IS1165 DDE domain-containing protein n=1 Tax=Methylocystis bryophila TaxID=655015 RepID=A0A1W6MUB4_9HYPH|nr:hypothetical protein B1812_09010 [Methylocystis bryophila]